MYGKEQQIIQTNSLKRSATRNGYVNHTTNSGRSLLQVQALLAAIRMK